MKRSGWLAATFILLALIGLAWFGLERLEEQTRKGLYQELTLALDSTTEALGWWVEERREEGRGLSLLPGLAPLVGAQVSLPSDSRSLARSSSLVDLRRLLEPELAAKGFSSFILIGPQGLIRAASTDDALGQKHGLDGNGSFLEPVLQGRTWLTTPLTGEKEAPGPGSATAFVLTPVREGSGPVLAVLALGLDLGSTLNRITLPGRFGLTGRTLLFDRWGRIITPSGFGQRLQGPRISAQAPGSGPGSLNPKPGSIQARSFLDQAGRRGRSLDGYPDPQGVIKVGSWRWVEEVGLGLIAEMELQEAKADYYFSRRMVILLLGGTAILLAALAGFNLRSRRASLPAAGRALSELKPSARSLHESEPGRDGLPSTKPNQDSYPILRLDGRGTIVYANQGGRSILKTWARRSGEAVPREWLNLAQKVLTDGTAREVELKVGYREYLIFLAPSPEEGHVDLYGIDISGRKEAERQLRLAGTVFETTHDGIIVTDPDGKIEMLNPAFSVITGYQPQEMIGRTFHLLSPERNEPEFLTRIWSDLQDKGQWQGETWNRRKNGEAFPEWHTINVVRTKEGELAHLVILFSDITQIKRSQEEIRRQAHHDTLTGLPNRLLFNDRLEMALRQARRRSEMLAIIFLDLDRFKEINDSLGHESGDLLLKEVAARLKDSLREEDTVARLGGDEFLILLRNVKAVGDAEEVAAKINASLAEVFWISDQSFQITSSLGLAFHPDHGQGAEELIKNADVAMYQAKNMGRNNYQVFSPDLDARTSKRLIIKTNLQRALEQEELEVLYQPLVALKDGTVVGVEALLRWPGGDRHRVEPAEFIQVAEETDLIVPLGEWAFKETFAQLESWRRQGMEGIYLTLNLSLPQLDDQSRLLAALKKALQGRDLDPGLIRLEIPERVFAGRFEPIRPALAELEDLGLKVSLGRFGIGRSALSLLNKASLTALRMDQSIIHDLGRTPESLALARAVIAMAHSLGMEVVAQGVESRTQLQTLAQILCDQAQGSLIAPPLPPEEVEVFIRRLSL